MDDPEGLAAALLRQQPISDLLQTILEFAVSIVEAVDAASVTVAVSEPPGFRTVGASDVSSRSLDQVQYLEGGGPCVAAVTGSEDVTISLPTPEWVRFSAAGVAAGYRSVRSMPLSVEGRTAGSLNLYSSAPTPWDRNSARAVRLISEQAQLVMLNAVDVARAEHANATLRRALETRTVIGQAQGVLMARQGVGAEEAFDVLRRASQRTNRKLRDIAAEIVAGAKSEQPHGC